MSGARARGGPVELRKHGPEPQHARNAQIIDARRQGLGGVTIGRLFGISDIRVYQIEKRHKAQCEDEGSKIEAEWGNRDIRAR